MIDRDDDMNALLYKREEYKHEEEVRALVFDKESYSQRKYVSPLKYMKRKIDIAGLIDSIYIQSTAPTWVLGLVQRMIEAYGYKFRVRGSLIDFEPLWWE